jgi:hypothetical protein
MTLMTSAKLLKSNTKKPPIQENRNLNY